MAVKFTRRHVHAKLITQHNNAPHINIVQHRFLPVLAVDGPVAMLPATAKRPRSEEPTQSQELADALDEIIAPHACLVEYDISLVSRMAALKDRIIRSDVDIMRWHDSISRGEALDGAVERSSMDKRYVLSLLLINLGKLQELKPHDSECATQCYSEALRWHCDSVEAGFRLGVWKRHSVASADELDEVERLWLRAHEACHNYNYFRHSRYNGTSSVPYASFNRMAQSREKGVMRELSDALILHFCQAGDLTKASVYLKALRYQYKLSQAILNYDDKALNSDQKVNIGEPVSELVGLPSVCQYAGGVDRAVPASLLSRLQYAFRPDSPFWAEHSYDFYSNASRSVGYFSYLFPFRELDPSNIVEQAIATLYNLMYRKFPEVLSRSTVGM